MCETNRVETEKSKWIWDRERERSLVETCRGLKVEKVDEGGRRGGDARAQRPGCTYRTG